MRADVGTTKKGVNRGHTPMALTKGHQESCEITLPQVQPHCLQLQPATRTEEGEADRRQAEARVPEEASTDARTQSPHVTSSEKRLLTPTCCFPP